MSLSRTPNVRSTTAQRWCNADGLLIGTRGRLYELDDRGRVLATFHEGEYSLCPGPDALYSVEPCGAPAPLGGICAHCIDLMMQEDAHQAAAAAERTAERAREGNFPTVREPMLVADEDGNFC